MELDSLFDFIKKDEPLDELKAKRYDKLAQEILDIFRNEESMHDYLLRMCEEPISKNSNEGNSNIIYLTDRVK